MNIFQQRYRWRLIFIVAALLIVSASLMYNYLLVEDMAKEERKTVELWASANEHVNSAGLDADVSFSFEVIEKNHSIPVILTDADHNIIKSRNLDSLKTITDESYLSEQLELMKSSYPPLKFDDGRGGYNYIYYKDSDTLVRMRYYPFIQLGVIMIFVLIAYFVFSTSKSSEQNRVWAGMAKETAHQLGTPISSLMAWMEHLKDDEHANQELLTEMEKDVSRLELVAERFSKIGSKPKRVPYNIIESLETSLEYMKRRASRQVQFGFHKQTDELMVEIDPALFEWVTENLLKNALDAMDGKGSIDVSVEQEQNGTIIIDVKDSGKGMDRSNFETVFEPGFSTKKRGWGLGLALCRRIIKEYHAGKIYVKDSERGKGTTFRIALPSKIG